jgi:hypothetical protein
MLFVLPYSTLPIEKRPNGNLKLLDTRTAGPDRGAEEIEGLNSTGDFTTVRRLPLVQTGSSSVLRADKAGMYTTAALRHRRVFW